MKEPPRIRNLPKAEQEPFAKWLRGQTVPHIKGVPENEQDGYYPWDYNRWKAHKRGERVLWD